MPTAICPQSHVIHWRATKGSTMPATCEVCGQPNKSSRVQAVRDENGHVVGWEPAPKKPRQKREYVLCPVCGVEKLVQSGGVKKFDTPTLVFCDPGLYSQAVEVPADTWLCRHHRPVPANTLTFFGGFITVQSCDEEEANIGIFSEGRSTYFHVNLPALDRQWRRTIEDPRELPPAEFDAILSRHRDTILAMIARLNQ